MLQGRKQDVEESYSGKNFNLEFPLTTRDDNKERQQGEELTDGALVPTVEVP